jgi:hypothetical protein
MRLAPLLLLTLLLGAPASWAEEPAPAPPAKQEEAEPRAERIVEQLLSPRAEEQARGETALADALRLPGDRAAAFARRLGELLRARLQPGSAAPAVLRVLAPAAPQAAAEVPPPAPPPPPAPAPGSKPESQVPAGDPLAERPAGASSEPPSEPAQEAKPSASPARDPAWDLKVWAVSVAAREVEGLLPTMRDVTGAVRGSKGRDGSRTILGPAEWAPAWAQTALRSADATPLAERVLALPDAEQVQLPLGSEVRYRRAAAQIKGGAWAVLTDTIRPGLTLAARLEGERLELEATWVEVALPMTTERVRPATNVEPIELDRPDWSAARRRLTLAVDPKGGAGLLVLPGLLPDAERRLVLVLSLLPR